MSNINNNDNLSDNNYSNKNTFNKWLNTKNKYESTQNYNLTDTKYNVVSFNTWLIANNFDEKVNCYNEIIKLPNNEIQKIIKKSDKKIKCYIILKLFTLKIPTYLNNISFINKFILKKLIF